MNPKDLPEWVQDHMLRKADKFQYTFWSEHACLNWQRKPTFQIWRAIVYYKDLWMVEL